MTTTTQPIVCANCATAGHPASECPDRYDMAVARRLLQDAQAQVLEAVRRINVVEAATDVRNYGNRDVMEAFGAVFQIKDALESLHDEDAPPKWIAA